MSGLRWRYIVIFLALVLTLAYSLPNVAGPSLQKFLPNSKVNLGLDLRGGIHLTLGVDVDKAVTNSLALTGQDLRREAMDRKIVVLRPHVVGGSSLEFILPRADDESAFTEFAAKRFPQLSLGQPVKGDAGQLRYVAHFTDQEVKRLETLTMDQALRTIRNRIDQFGVAEPDIRKQSDNRIQVQLPGISDPRHAVKILGQTAHLEFHMVRDDVDATKAVMPAGVIALPLLEKSHGQLEKEAGMIAVDKDAVLTGEDVSDARPAFDNLNQSYVSLTFNSRGADVFERLTAESVGKRMAIVLDGKVYSAPVIRERIGGGRASISGNFTTDEANDLAIVLRAGSLPAPVNILEERTVGPSLGKESIESGILAAAVGGIAVMVVMPLYYGLAGLLADVMLVFTITMLMAGLAAFGATLTLPGIAGIVLTIGMSVDANVLIFERIREEIRQGLKPLEAVAVGFDRATISIVDSNLTTIIAAAILYQFGTGPVRGFAVTLSLGIVASMFTAIFVSRTAFGLWLGGNDGKKLSI